VRSSTALARLYGPVLASACVAAGLEFLILGPLEVLAAGRALDLGAAKQRALLALLLLHANELVSVDRLVEELWGGDAPATAAHSIQVYVSQLRKVFDQAGIAGADVLFTRPPGYLLKVAPDQFDLRRFERLAEDAEQSLATGDVAAAGDLLREALALWRGGALADFAYESFAQAPAARLEEVRLAATERRIEADLLLGRHAELTGELEQLVADHPLRERPHGQLMLALYRSGRQADALDVYRRLRSRLTEELGLDPSSALQLLERKMLQHDPELELGSGAGRANSPVPGVAEHSILVLGLEDGALERLLVVAEPLAKLPSRELILAACVRNTGDLEGAVARLHEQRGELLDRGVSARAAAFTSAGAGAEAVRLVSEHDVELLLVEASEALLADLDSGELGLILDRAPCHVGVLLGSGAPPGRGRVVVPFGGAEHDWAAVELGAWLARGAGVPLRLLGIEGEPDGSTRDASRLLASASLAVQRVAGIPAEPQLIAGGTASLLAASADAFALVLGLSSRWRHEGIGAMRLELARVAATPTLLVRSSLRPAGLAPPATVTRYTWSLAPASAD
jgi:DNA-binding SARP family transcriptional activator